MFLQNLCHIKMMWITVCTFRVLGEFITPRSDLSIQITLPEYWPPIGQCQVINHQNEEYTKFEKRNEAQCQKSHRSCFYKVYSSSWYALITQGVKCAIRSQDNIITICDFRFEAIQQKLQKSSNKVQSGSLLTLWKPKMIYNA